MTYTWNFLDAPYLDGLIVAAGTMKSKRAVSIRINEIPFELIGRIEEMFCNIGGETDILECPNAVTKSTDLRMNVYVAEPIFGDLPRYRERRFDVANAPMDFVHGYLVGGIRVKFQDISRLPILEGHDWITIHNPLPKYDQIELLERCNITEMKELFDLFYIRDTHFRNKEPFETVYTLLKKEFEVAKKHNPSKAEQLEQLSEEIMGTKGSGFFNPEEPDAGGGTY
jgi:hypothetical protein